MRAGEAPVTIRVHFREDPWPGQLAGVALGPCLPARLRIGGPENVSVGVVAYQPGQSSGWQRHNGLHAVAVPAGSLTVYDAECRAHTFEAGSASVGGQAFHLVRNETADAVQMEVTSLTSAVDLRSPSRWPRPRRVKR